MCCSWFFVVGSLVCWSNFTSQYFPLLQSKDTLYVSLLKIRSNKSDLQLAGALIVDRPLGIVAVDHQYVPLQGIVEIAGEKCRKGRLADTSLLIADGDVPGAGCLLIGSFHRLMIWGGDDLLCWIFSAISMNVHESLFGWIFPEFRKSVNPEIFIWRNLFSIEYPCCHVSVWIHLSAR